MNILHAIILIVHVLAALGIVGLVLLQHGKGADMGAGFGSGASGSLFGATGAANFLSRTTAILATVFFITSLGLTYTATHRPRADAGVMEAAKPAPEVAAPQRAAPDKPAADDPPAAKSAPEGAASRVNEVPK